MIVLCSTQGLVSNGPGQTVGVSVFTDFLIRNRTIRRVEIRAAFVVGTFPNSFLVAFFGHYIE